MRRESRAAEVAENETGCMRSVECVQLFELGEHGQLAARGGNVHLRYSVSRVTYRVHRAPQRRESNPRGIKSKQEAGAAGAHRTHARVVFSIWLARLRQVACRGRRKRA